LIYHLILLDLASSLELFNLEFQSDFLIFPVIVDVTLSRSWSLVIQLLSKLHDLLLLIIDLLSKLLDNLRILLIVVLIPELALQLEILSLEFL
jgi:hypothetical protein